jgi:hypothetical protein
MRRTVRLMTSMVIALALCLTAGGYLSAQQAPRVEKHPARVSKSQKKKASKKSFHEWWRTLPESRKMAVKKAAMELYKRSARASRAGKPTARAMDRKYVYQSLGQTFDHSDPIPTDADGHPLPVVPLVDCTTHCINRTNEECGTSPDQIVNCGLKFFERCWDDCTGRR